MPGGKLWTSQEDDFILKHVAMGRTNRGLVKAFIEEFGETRTIDAIRKRRATLQIDEPLPDVGDVTYEETENALHVVVVSAGDIKTIEDLREAAEVDLDVWEEYRADVRNRYQAMKDEDGKPIVIEIRYIKLEYRRKAESRFDLSPYVLTIVRPKVRQPGKTTRDVSVHFGDKHIPFDDERATSILHQILDLTDPTVVVDHGDTLDAEQIGRYPKDPLNRVSLREEIRRGAEHFGEITALVRDDCRKVWLEGNHEERKRRLVWELADKRAYGELVTLPNVMEALEWRNLLGIASLGWEDYPYISDGKKPNHVVLFDRLICKHGAASSGDVARKEYQKHGKSGLSGHLHRMQVHSRRDWNGQHQWHCLGMMGQIRDAYVDHANWQQGLMVVQWSPRKDRFAFEPVQIIDGECFFRGLRLTG